MGYPARPRDMASYVVKFLYREPTYAKSRGIAEVDYVASFEVSASSSREAEAEARRCFAEATAMASVSWARVIVFTEVREAE